MNKSLKIFLSILALIVVSFSALYYFNLIPFFSKQKKTGTPTQTAFNLPTSKDASLSGLVEKSTSSCIILEEQYCNQGKMVYDGEELLGIGFRLPRGIKIYVPFKSKIEDEKGLKIIEINKKSYSAAVLLDLSKGTDEGDKNFFVAIGYPKLENKNDVLEKGEFLASTEGMFIENVIGAYKLVLTFRNFNVNTGQWRTDIDLLRQFFPNTQK